MWTVAQARTVREVGKKRHSPTRLPRAKSQRTSRTFFAVESEDLRVRGTTTPDGRRLIAASGRLLGKVRSSLSVSRSTAIACCSAGPRRRCHSVFQLRDFRSFANTLDIVSLRCRLGCLPSFNLAFMRSGRDFMASSMKNDLAIRHRIALNPSRFHMDFESSSVISERWARLLRIPCRPHAARSARADDDLQPFP